MAGKLVICPTPIGNLADLSMRTVEALRSADVVCAEDTRVTGRLLAAVGIEGKRIERLDENVIAQRGGGIIDRAAQGEVIAYCSDAGTPGVSDPGLRLVAAARAAGVAVEALPGPTAAVTAYVASGTTSPTFYFGGFFPRKDGSKHQLFDQLRTLDAALIFYESPNRLVGTLAAIAEAYPHREVAVARELTKLHEEVVRATAPEVHAEFAGRKSIKGEIVIVIDPPSSEEQAPDLEAARARAADLSASGLRPKAIAQALAAEYHLPRNQAYDLALGN